MIDLFKRPGIAHRFTPAAVLAEPALRGAKCVRLSAPVAAGVYAIEAGRFGELLITIHGTDCEYGSRSGVLHVADLDRPLPAPAQAGAALRFVGQIPEPMAD
jgi:hypothetical protein